MFDATRRRFFQRSGLGLAAAGGWFDPAGGTRGPRRRL